MPHEIRELEDPLPTRWSLIRRLRNPEDQDSWGKFAELYRGLILGTALRTGLTHPEAEEVVQNTLLSVHHNIEQLKTDPSAGSFKGWLLRLTQWRIADQFRRRSHAQPLKSDSSTEATSVQTSTAERVPDPHADFEAIWNSEWETHLLALAVRELKEEIHPEHFQIFDFSVLRQWPVTRVASSMGVNVGQVYLLKHRIGKLLKKKLARIERELA